METTITATELAKGLSDILNRVKYRGERFVVQRNGETVAVIEPANGRPSFTWGQFVATYHERPRPDDRFADDLEAVLADREMLSERPVWPD